MIHEDAVLAKHPTAKEFRPVEVGTFRKRLIGWTFKVPSAPDSFVGNYGWVTHDGEVSSSTLDLRYYATGNLRAYVRSRRGTTPINLVEDAK